MPSLRRGAGPAGGVSAMMRGRMADIPAKVEKGPATPNSHSMRGVAKMLAPRWPLIMLSTVSIVLFAVVNLARPRVVQKAIDSGVIGDDRHELVVMSIVFFFLTIDMTTSSWR